MLSTKRLNIFSLILLCALSFRATAQTTSDFVTSDELAATKNLNFKMQHALENKVVEISDGKQTRKFKVLSQLGSGGFGEVLLAESVEGPKEQIALKIFFNRSDDRGLSLAEASHVTAYRDLNKAFEGGSFPESVLQYSNPCTIQSEYGATLIGVYSAVMAESLKNQIPRLAIKLGSDSSAEIDAKLTEILKTLKPILEGLTRLHEAGVSHNDLKSANILLKDGKIKLADFDALTIIGSVNHKLSNTYYTLEYSAPERIGSDPNGRQLPISDAYSVGATIFELIFGETALRGMVSSSQTPDSEKIQKDVANFLLRAKRSAAEFSKLTNHIKSKFAVLRSKVTEKEGLEQIHFFESFILASSEFDPAVRMNALEKLSETHTFLKSYLKPMRNAFSEVQQKVFATKFNLNHVACGGANAETLVKSVVF